MLLHIAYGVNVLHHWCQQKAAFDKYCAILPRPPPQSETSLSRSYKTTSKQRKAKGSGRSRFGDTEDSSSLKTEHAEDDGAVDAFDIIVGISSLLYPPPQPVEEIKPMENTESWTKAVASAGPLHDPFTAAEARFE